MEPGQGSGGDIQKQFVGLSENENENMAPVERAVPDQIPTHDSPEDRLLPAATVHRIMKQILPSEAKVTKEAKEAMQLCATQFIRWVMYNANTYCQNETRSMVTAEDIILAIKELGFDNYDRILTVFLNRYRESPQGKPSTYEGPPNMMNPFGPNAHPSRGPCPPVPLGFIPQFMPPVPAPGPSGVQEEGTDIDRVNEGPFSSSSRKTGTM